MATFYEKVGNRIRELRNKKNMSQEAVALDAKVDLTTISEIECGLRNPSLKTIVKIAKALKVEPYELLKV